MNIILDDNYTLETDENQWTLKFHSERFDEEKQKTVNSNNQTYHSTIGQALKKYLDNCLKPSEDVADLWERFIQAEARIGAITKKEIDETVFNL